MSNEQRGKKNDSNRHGQSASAKSAEHDETARSAEDVNEVMLVNNENTSGFEHHDNDEGEQEQRTWQQGRLVSTTIEQHENEGTSTGRQPRRSTSTIPPQAMLELKESENKLQRCNQHSSPSSAHSRKDMVDGKTLRKKRSSRSNVARGRRSSRILQRRRSSYLRSRIKRDPGSPPIPTARRRFLRAVKTPSSLNGGEAQDDLESLEVLGLENSLDGPLNDMDSSRAGTDQSLNTSFNSQPGAYFYYDEDIESNIVRTYDTDGNEETSVQYLSTSSTSGEQWEDDVDMLDNVEQTQGGVAVATQVNDATPVVYPTHVEKDTTEQASKNNKSLHIKYGICFLVVFVILIGLMVGLWIGLTQPTSSDSQEPPKVNVTLDRCQVYDPDIMLQCECNDTIATMPQGYSIEKYQEITDRFMQEGVLSPTQANASSTTCMPSTISRWSMTTASFENTQDMMVRYVLGVLFAAWDGYHWTSHDGWLDLDLPSNNVDNSNDNNNIFDDSEHKRPGGGALSKSRGRGDFKSSYCNWFGVKCNFRGEFQRLELPKNKLKGTLPQEIGFLTSLRLLNLDSNGLRGKLPTNALQKLTNLRSLVLRDNQFLGRLDFQDWVPHLSVLQELDLDRNGLVGIGLPTEVGMLTSLRTLRMDHNRLSGSIPTELGLLDDLETLTLSRCEFSGSIPCEFGHLRDLETLVLSFNSLTGTIPTELSLMENLELLVVSGNKFDGGENNTNNIIPEEICDLVFLNGIITDCSDNDTNDTSTITSLDDCPCCVCGSSLGK